MDVACAYYRALLIRIGFWGGYFINKEASKDLGPYSSQRPTSQVPPVLPLLCRGVREW